MVSLVSGGKAVVTLEVSEIFTKYKSNYFFVYCLRQYVEMPNYFPPNIV